MRPNESRKKGTTGRDHDQFPVGMRVLAVDDDPVCLKVLENLLRRCQYEVTTTDQAVIALKILRENRDMFDLVISDVHMPYMDGFQLLERVGVEMDLPVVMLSVNGEMKSVMKGITSGACDYLLKPVRIEQLKNIWQHVVRRRRKFSTNPDNNVCDQSERPSNKRKRKECHSVDEDENEDSSNGQKRARIIWSFEMHMKFVTAVTQLGVNKAVPRRILELMDVKNLTREHVASHLQNYRLNLRRLNALKSRRQSGIYAALGGRDPFLCMNEFLRLQDYYQATITSPPDLASSFSAQGLLTSVRNENQSVVVAQEVSTRKPAWNMLSHLSLPGNQHGNLGQVQVQHKCMSADDSGDLSTIVSGKSKVQSVTCCPLLPQDLVVECIEANMAIQPSIRVPSASLQLLEPVVGSSFGPLDLESAVSQQSALRLPVNGSFNSNGATRLGDTFAASRNSFTVLKANESIANSLIGPKIAKSSSQLPRTVDAQHSINQRSTNCSMFGHTSAGASQVVPHTKISGDTWTPRIASEPKIPSLPSELSSSTCSLDCLLDSMIKFKVDNGDAASNDDLWCDFYPSGTCT